MVNLITGLSWALAVLANAETPADYSKYALTDVSTFHILCAQILLWP